MIRLVLPILVAVLCPLLSGCASEAEPCAIGDNGDGTSTLRCDGKTFVIPGGASGSDCTLVRAEDGSGIITCADGTVIRIGPDGRPIFPGKGTIAGSAQYLGLDDHAGIVVRAVGTSHSTTTDSKGQYLLTDLPAGVYSLSFEGRDRAPERIENVPALDGLYVAAPVVLRLGVQISEQSPWQVIESPRKDSLFVSEAFGSSRLTIWDLASKTSTVLSATASWPSFSPDGRHLLFIEDRSMDGKAVVWDVDQRRAETIFDGARKAEFLADGRTVLVFADSLVLVDLETKETVTIPDSSQKSEASHAPDGKAVAWTKPDGQVAFWDVEGRSATAVSVFSPVEIEFTPDGRGAVIMGRDPGGRNVIFHQDLGADVGTTLATYEGWANFHSPIKDRYVVFDLFEGSSRKSHVWVRGERTPRLLGPDLHVVPMLGEDALLLRTLGVGLLDDSSAILSLYDVASGASTVLAPDLIEFQPSPSGRSVLVLTASGEWELVGLPGKERTAIPDLITFQWSPDGVWLWVMVPGSTKVIRASTGRSVDMGRVQATDFTGSGTGLFFLVRDEEDPSKTFLGLWDLEREKADMLGLFRGTVWSSHSGKTVFLWETPSRALLRVAPKTGARELIESEVVRADPWMRFDSFLLYESADGGTWLTSAFE